MAPENGSRRRLPTQAWVLGLIGLALAVAAAACSRHSTESPVGGSGVPPSKVNLKRNVELGRAEQRSLVHYIETVGVLEAENQTEIAAGVSGVVDEVLFREGDAVTPKTVLVKVDQRRFVSAAKVAEANVARADAGLAMARDQVARTRQAGAGVSPEERTKAILNLGVAEAELLSARAALDLANHNLERSQVRPPYAGRINQRRVTPGTFVEEKAVVGTIADLTHLRLVGWVPETAAPLVRDLMAQQEARVRAAKTVLPLVGGLDSTIPWGTVAALLLLQKDQVPSGYDPEFTLLAYPQRQFRGRIFYLSTVANPETHMFECKAEVDTRGLDVEPRPGLTARIRLPLRSNSAACTVPEEAVRASERGFVAFVPVQRTGRDGKVEWVAKARTVDVGYRAPGWLEVRQGILPGEWIVRRGAEALEDGTPIRFNEATLAKDAR
jgi:multidrug efflux system membrane fusion protein